MVSTVRLFKKYSNVLTSIANTNFFFVKFFVLYVTWIWVIDGCELSRQCWQVNSGPAGSAPNHGALSRPCFLTSVLLGLVIVQKAFSIYLWRLFEHVELRDEPQELSTLFFEPGS